MDQQNLKVHPIDSIILPGSRFNFKQLNEQIKSNTQCSLDYIDSISLTKMNIKIPVINYTCNGQKSDLYTIYFHGNGENNVEQMYFYNELTQNFKSNIVAMEYSGYALYNSYIVDSEQIKADSITTFDYLVNQKGIKPENIIILGRSIGSGPACYLASQRKCAGVIIFSGFSRIVTWLKEKNVKRELTERFDNIDCVKNIKSPTLIIHGTKDNVINVSHAKDLEAEFIKHHLPVKAHYDEEMQHNYYSFEKLAEYINEFAKEYKIIQ